MVLMIARYGKDLNIIGLGIGIYLIKKLNTLIAPPKTEVTKNDNALYVTNLLGYIDLVLDILKVSVRISCE